MGVNSTVNNSMVLGDCGRLQLCVIYFSNSIKFWCKLLHMPITKYAPNCYQLLKSLDENNRYTWATSIKNLLFRYRFGLGFHKRLGMIGISYVFSSKG